MKKDLIYYTGKGIKKMAGFFKKSDIGSQMQPSAQAEPASPAPADVTDASANDTSTQSSATLVKKPIAMPEPADVENTPEFDYDAFLGDVRVRIYDKVQKLVAKSKTYPDRYLFVYVNDEAIYQTSLQHNMGHSLNEYMDDRTGDRFKDVHILTGPVKPGLQSIKVNDKVIIAVGSGTPPPPPPPPARSAVITMLYGTSECTLVGGDVILDPAKNTLWNIGWGRDAEVNHRPRTNHIALQYKNPEQHEADDYMISRAHAHIKSYDGTFYLYVEPRGTRQAGKRTKIERGNQIFELSDVRVGRPLRNGDVIRLNGEYLLFTLNDK